MTAKGILKMHDFRAKISRKREEGAELSPIHRRVGKVGNDVKQKTKDGKNKHKCAIVTLEVNGLNSKGHRENKR